MSILITGSNGYLGSRYLTWCKKNKDVQILGLARTTPSDLNCDLLDLDALILALKTLQEGSVIFHFAGSPYEKNISRLYKSFIQPTLNLIQASKYLKMNFKIILIGSAAEYGNLHTNPLKEDQLVKPCSNYGFIKSLQTELAFSEALDNTDLICARIFNVVSGKEPNDLYFGRLMSAIERGDKVIETGNLDLVRDYLIEDDVFEALFQLYTKFNIAKNNIFNISSGTGINLRHLTQQIVQSLDSGIDIQETNLNFKPDIQTSIGDNSKIKKITNLTLSSNIEKIINQFQIS